MSDSFCYFCFEEKICNHDAKWSICFLIVQDKGWTSVESWSFICCCFVDSVFLNELTKPFLCTEKRKLDLITRKVLFILNIWILPIHIPLRACLNQWCFPMMQIGTIIPHKLCIVLISGQCHGKNQFQFIHRFRRSHKNDPMKMLMSMVIWNQVAWGA